MRLGDFVLEEEIGRGGMGVVYRAWQVSLEREVALKLMRDVVASGDGMATRFRTEALAAAGLQHPGIVRIHGAGECGGLQWLSMDYVEGMSVAAAVQARGPLEPRLAARYAAEIAGAIQHAHEMGVVHRDLKPSNVLIDGYGRARVLDFGMARMEGAEPLTLSGEMIGTPGYMSPEQAAGLKSAASPATDVYGIGAILYFMLTGTAPFTGDSAGEVLKRAAEGYIRPVRHLNPRTPGVLEIICGKCLRPRPEERYRSAGAAEKDLRNWLSGGRVEARDLSVWRRTGHWLKRHPGWAAALVMMLAALSALLLWADHQRRHVWPWTVVCGDIIRTVEGPRPVAVFDSDLWKQRQVSMRVTTRGRDGPVVKVESISGDGSPFPGGLRAPFIEIGLHLKPLFRPQVMELEYDDSGRLMEETLRDAEGGLVSRARWSYPKDEPGPPRAARVDFFDAAGEALQTGTAACGARLKASVQGEWNEVYFLDALGRPALADKGVYGRRITRPEPAWLKTEYLDPDGQLMNNLDGVAREEIVMDEAVTRQERRTFDKTGRPVLREGHHLQIKTFDGAGNETGLAFFGVDGVSPVRATASEGTGASRVAHTWDSRGRLKETEYEGCDPEVQGAARLRLSRTWPEDGKILYVLTTHYLDKEGNPARNLRGFGMKVESYDLKGQRIRLEER